MDPGGESIEKNATANSGGCTGLELGGVMICNVRIHFSNLLFFNYPDSEKLEV